MLNYKNFKIINEDVNNPKLNKAAASKMRQSITSLTLNYGFFADLLLSLKIMETKQPNKYKTMATDGRSIVYNADFVNKLDIKEVKFVILHEVMHNANFHFLRRGTRKPRRWNRAADFAINIQLDDMSKEGVGSKLLKFPTMGLLNQEYRDMSAEQIYEILLEKDKQKQKEQQKFPKQPPRGIEVGDKVRIKANDKIGIVSKLNPDGTFEIDVVNESLLLESYTMADVVLIVPKQPKQPKGDGQGPPPPPFDPDLDVENEDDEGEDGDDGESDDGEADDDFDDEDEGEDGDMVEDEDGDGDSDSKGKGKGKKGDGDDDGDPSGGGGDGDEDPGDDDICEPGSLDGETLYEGSKDLQEAHTAAEVNKKWGEILAQAKTNNPGGTGSPSLDRWFNKIDKPKVNWKARLKRFMQKAFSSVPEYKGFNKRFIAGGDYWPGIKRPVTSGYKCIVLCIDTSGSIDQDTLSKFASEFYGILTSGKVAETIIIWCDDRIQKVERLQTKGVSGTNITSSEFEKTFLQKLTPSGRGGTSFFPPFDWIQQNLLKKGLNPSFVVYFTDAMGDAPTMNHFGIKAYFQRVLWVITGTTQDSPYAQRIRFPEKIYLDSEGKS